MKDYLFIYLDNAIDLIRGSSYPFLEIMHTNFPKAH
jgi:hypothetical protein